MQELQCYNRGCGNKYNPEENKQGLSFDYLPIIVLSVLTVGRFYSVHIAGICVGKK